MTEKSVSDKLRAFADSFSNNRWFTENKLFGKCASIDFSGDALGQLCSDECDLIYVSSCRPLARPDFCLDPLQLEQQEEGPGRKRIYTDSKARSQSFRNRQKLLLSNTEIERVPNDKFWNRVYDCDTIVVSTSRVNRKEFGVFARRRIAQNEIVSSYECFLFESVEQTPLACRSRMLPVSWLSANGTQKKAFVCGILSL